jgi:hypothetical protein
MDDTKTTTVRLKSAIDQRVRKYAERHGISFAAAVSTLLVRALEAEEGKAGSDRQ